MAVKRNQIKLIIYLIFLSVISSISSSSIDALINKYEAIIENLAMHPDGRMTATHEISTNKQILILPTSRVMSSEENYQFKEYFSRSSKEKLVGRLLIERFIGNASYYYEFIETLPIAEELTDYYHYSDGNKEELEKRSLLKFSWSDRRNEYETLIRKIPSNVNKSFLPKNLYFILGNSFKFVELRAL
jgi:hypothetical protein